jgi:hypothetical protein
MTQLPKIEFPIHNINVPSLKGNFKFRPFLVKEEKILLMAKESKIASDILLAVKQIINNCAIDKKLDIDKLSIFDLEYIFLKLRAISVDNISKVAYKDNEDNSIYQFDVDLNDVQLIIPENANNNIKITENSGIIMRYPPASLYDDQEFLNLEKDYMFELILRCVDKVYLGEEIYETKNYKKSDLSEFLESLSIKTFEDIQKFLLNSPKMEYKIQYKNNLGNDREIVLNSLNDFFTWR